MSQRSRLTSTFESGSRASDVPGSTGKVEELGLLGFANDQY